MINKYYYFRKIKECYNKTISFFSKIISEIVHFSLHALVAIFTLNAIVTAYFLTFRYSVLSKAEKVAYQVEKQQKSDQKLGEYILFLMDMKKSPLTDYQKQLITQNIIRACNNVFSTDDEKRSYAVVINNESNFNPLAKSSAGAVGLAQIMPAYATEFASHCNMGKMSSSDIMNIETNLMLGACRFKHLLEEYKGDVGTALLAYNAGKNAKSIKEFHAITDITNKESAGYITKFMYPKTKADLNEKSQKLIELKKRIGG